MRLGGLVLAAAALALAPATSASAEPAVALMSDGATVATFDTSTPERPSGVQSISGLQSPASERAIGIDWRPRTGQVVLVTVPIGATIDALVRTYVLDPSTGVATFIGSTTEPDAADVPTGMDFNPTVDRIRMAMSNDENFRINPNDGSLASTDTDLHPAGNKIIAAAYDRNFDRTTASPPTTLYEISRAGSSLFTQGGIDGIPSPNGGTLAAVGPLGIDLSPGADGGLDISPNSNIAFAALVPNGSTLPLLYTINLSTGAATEIGGFVFAVTDLTILPIPPGGSTSGGGSSTTTPPPPPPPAPPTLIDRTPPAGTMILPKKGRISVALGGKLKIGFTCDEACLARALIRLSGGAARTVTLAQGTASLPAAGRGTITLKPTRAGKKAMRGARKRHKSMKTTVSMTLTDSAANAVPITRKLGLKH
jgi:hypothetical protein